MFIHKLFFESARRTPVATAISFGEERLTYADCAVKVQQLAAGLSERFAPGARVGINAFKSIDTILMMLACLEAGMTYVPIDPASPISRRRFILKDCEATALYCDARTMPDWGGDIPVEQVSLETLSSETGQRRDTTVHADDLAYILYTSGSTGEPKGVMISHKNAAAFVEWGMAYFDLHPGDNVAVHAPLHFDLPVFDIYVALACGATVCPIAERVLLFPQGLLQFLQKNTITVLYAVPSALTALINRSTLAATGLPDLRLVLYAGEEFHPGPLRKLMEALPEARVFNLYGPIETNVVTALPVTPERLDQPRIPIGRPISNTRIFLIDGTGDVIDAPDEEGEIVVSGASVSPGYLNRPELTETSRIRVSAEGRKWECYRTGDFGRWDSEGVIHFLGRRDALVKTRGFRVELGDIEAALLTHPEIAEAGVIAKPHPEYTNLLYAFVVLKRGSHVGESDLQAWCRDLLPGYMMPHEIVFRDHLPKTSTGKISRRELSEENVLNHGS